MVAVETIFLHAHGATKYNAISEIVNVRMLIFEVVVAYGCCCEYEGNLLRLGSFPSGHCHQQHYNYDLVWLLPTPRRPSSYRRLRESSTLGNWTLPKRAGGVAGGLL